MAIQSGNRLTPTRLNTRGVRARRAAAQTLTTGTLTAISWDTEDWDNASMFSGSSTSITLPVAGLWGVLAYAGFTSNATGQRRLLLEEGSSGVYPTIDSRPAVSGDATHVTMSGSYVAATAGVTIRIRAHQTSGGNLDVLAGAYFTAWLIES
ncbi:hypothetical protein AB0J20_16240 [Micromonospora costi]|uniref:hypothetical protein n=1 Tax=Micromonospora costi TaxID=1530042 RepID=UPI0033E2F3DA